MTVHLPAAGVHQNAFSGGQQKMLDEFVMRIRGVETRIVPFHPHLPVGTGMDFPEAEPVDGPESRQNVTCTAGDSTVELPVQKAKTEYEDAGEEGLLGLIARSLL